MPEEYYRPTKRQCPLSLAGLVPGAAGEADFVAPAADLLVVDPVDGAVFPLGRRSQRRRDVRVVGGGVGR